MNRGGVDITANSKDRLYLLGSKDVVTTGEKNLYTYNATTYFENGNLVIAGSQMAKISDLPSRSRQSSMIACGYLQMNGTTAVSYPDGLHYNQDYVSAVSVWKTNKGIGLTVNFKTYALMSKYKRLIQVTPHNNGNDVTNENYLSCCVGTSQTGNNATFYIYVFDTNNGANFKEGGYGASFFIPNVEQEY